MNKRNIAISLIGSTVVFFLIAGCTPHYTPNKIVSSMKEFKSLIPGIQAGLALGRPEEPTSRALDPLSNPPVSWPYNTDATDDQPSEVYALAGGAGSIIWLPSSTTYYTMDNGDKVRFSMKPDNTVVTPGYLIAYYTYPAFDLSVSYTLETYYVDSDAMAPGWPWGNLGADGLTGYVSLTTKYTDGTTGARTLVWTSGTSGDYYPVFTVGDPDPLNISSFVGYRYEESNTPPTASASGLNYSSSVTEQITGKSKTVIDSDQYYTESTATTHSGLTYIFLDRTRKWAIDTYIVTRMQENTATAVKKIRSVGEVGTNQYYIDKVDISKDAGGKIVYTSTHDVYITALPRSVNALAEEGQSLEVTEDSVGAGTFTGTIEDIAGDQKTVRDLKIKRGSGGQLVLTYSNKRTGPRALADEVEVFLTTDNLGNLSIPVPDLDGTFDGYYEAGSLYGTLTTSLGAFDIVIGVEGIAVDDVLY